MFFYLLVSRQIDMFNSEVEGSHIYIFNITSCHIHAYLLLILQHLYTLLSYLRYYIKKLTFPDDDSYFIRDIPI